MEAGPEQFPQIRLQADLEEEDDDPDLGQGVEDLGLVDQAEHSRPDQHARQQLAQDGRLADALHRLAGQLGREPDDRQAEQELAESHLLSLLHSAIGSAAR